MKTHFELTPEEVQKIDIWFKEQEAASLKMQKENILKLKEEDPSYESDAFIDSILEAGHPYYGAIGGVLTYSFTPTSIGTFITVEHGYTKNKIELGMDDF